MMRRTLLGGFAALAGVGSARAVSSLSTAGAFPCISVPGAEALAMWARLKAEGEGWPVVVGDDEELASALEALTLDERTPEQILALADKLAYPQAIEKLFADEWGEDPLDIAVGDWPSTPARSTGLSVAQDVLTGAYKPKVNILLLPTRDSAEVFAHLKWGGWNACPPPEHHVVAARAWARRYGAEVVGVSGDVVNMRVSRRPADRPEALELAREQLSYCSDIVLQGTGDLAPLAGQLLADDWWFFWWD